MDQKAREKAIEVTDVAKKALETVKRSLGSSTSKVSLIIRDLGYSEDVVAFIGEDDPDDVSHALYKFVCDRLNGRKEFVTKEQLEQG